MVCLTWLWMRSGPWCKVSCHMGCVMANRESCAGHAIELRILPKDSLAAWFIVFDSSGATVAGAKRKNMVLGLTVEMGHSIQ